MSPVSYTHLDVYKRQGVKLLKMPFIKSQMRSQGLKRNQNPQKQMSRNLRMHLRTVNYSMAVSYTHLDVYKRQIPE